MATLIQLAIGISLAGACGCRLFVTLLVLAASTIMGRITLESSWITHPQTIVILILGTVIEVMAFYRPRLDNLMDAIALPSAVISGVMIMASVAYSLPLPWRWLVAVVWGGGIALILQSASTLIRAQLTTCSGGVNNGLFATIELAAALGITLMVLLEPRITAIAVLVLVGFALRYLYVQIKERYDKRRKTESVIR